MVAVSGTGNKAWKLEVEETTAAEGRPSALATHVLVMGKTRLPGTVGVSSPAKAGLGLIAWLQARPWSFLAVCQP